MTNPKSCAGLALTGIIHAQSWNKPMLTPEYADGGSTVNYNGALLSIQVSARTVMVEAAKIAMARMAINFLFIFLHLTMIQICDSIKK